MRFREDASPVLVFVQVVHELRFGVPPADTHVAGVKHFAQLVADEIDDALEIERARHALLNTVDHRELGIALLGLFEKALRLIEEARVFKRGAERRGDRRKQSYVRIAERVLALEVLDRDRSDQSIAADDRDCDERFAPIGARYWHPLLVGRVEHDGLSRFLESFE
jgi:hypothetical protein